MSLIYKFVGEFPYMVSSNPGDRNIYTKKFQT